MHLTPQSSSSYSSLPPAVSNRDEYLKRLDAQQLSDPLVVSASQDLLDHVMPYMDRQSIFDIIDACKFGDDAHINDRRKSGEPYITHPIAVAAILADYRVDADTLIAAILHDTVEDTDITTEQVAERYNDIVATLVDGVTKLKISSDKKLNKAATFRKILTATLVDLRVLVIKLADRLHNMSTLDAVREEKRIATAQETLDFYIPFARLMSLNDLADRIEMLCYENLDSQQFQRLQQQLTQHNLQRTHQKSLIKRQLGAILKELRLQGTVVGLDNRVTLFKTFFRNRGKINALIQTYSISVVLPRISDCDRLAKALIQRYHIRPECIKDHIRKPYVGGNQALVLMYISESMTIELKIQTEQMVEAERLGVIMGRTIPEASQAILQASFRKLHELVDGESAVNTLESLMDYLHQQKYLCYTPDGDVHELPRKSTVLDFAYDIDTRLAHHAHRAKVDGKEVSLATPIESGQTIEILTKADGTPKAEWLGFVTTAKARLALQNWLVSLSLDEQRTHGKHALNRALQTYGYTLDDMEPHNWSDVFTWLNIQTEDELYQQLATGYILPQLVVSRLFAPETTEAHPRKSLIKQSRGINIQLAHCCNPIYGDPLAGHLTREGLFAHRHKCDTIKDAHKIDSRTVITLDWEKHTTYEAWYTVMLDIHHHCSDEELSNALLALRQINVGMGEVKRTQDITQMQLLVTSRNHTAQAMRTLRQILGYPNIHRLYRLENTKDTTL